MREYIGREIKIVRFRIASKRGHAREFGFADPQWTWRATPVADRAAFAAIGAYLNAFRPGLRKDKPIMLPVVVRDESDRSVLMDEAPSNFVDEARAYDLAAALTKLFACDAEVVADAAGWLVVVDDPTRSFSAEDMVMMRGVCRVLTEYTLAPAPFALGREKRTPSPEAREAFRRARSVEHERSPTCRQ